MEFTLIYRSKIIIKAYQGWIANTDKVLDIGCGNGVVTEELRKNLQCLIVGTDVLDYRKRDIPFRVMTDKSGLPFKDNEFDTAMFNDSLHHCDDQEALLKEAARVAKKVLIFEMEPTLIAKILEVCLNRIHNPLMNIPFNIRTSEDWRCYFTRLNFDFEYWKIEKPFFYPFDNFVFVLKRKS